MVIFYSYVKLPEGTCDKPLDFRSTTMSFQDMAMDQYLYIAFLGG
jgi:hypothetical protein